MIGFYPELLGKEIPDKKVLQARINLLLQKREDKMLAEKSEEAEFVEIE
jgi:hypothetical protein